MPLVPFFRSSVLLFMVCSRLSTLIIPSANLISFSLSYHSIALSVMIVIIIFISTRQMDL